MVNNNKPYQYFLNLTHLKENIILECEFPKDLPYNDKLNIPPFTTLGKYLDDLKKITQPILKIEGTLPKGNFNIFSKKRGGSSVEIISKEKLEELCDMLNEGREEEKIFKLVS